MELFVVLTGLKLVLSIILAWVIYQYFKAAYPLLFSTLELTDRKPFLFKLDPKVVSILLVICFLAMIL